MIHPSALLLATSLLAPPALSMQGGWSSGSDGSDGALDFSNGCATCPAGITEVSPNVFEIDLSQFDANYGKYATGDYGQFQGELWAMVFHYTTISVPAGLQVQFKNHRTHAPVVWLATGDVVIDSYMNLTGADGHFSTDPASFAEPGPGGFRGGRGSYYQQGKASCGFGPGGGGLSEFASSGGSGSHQGAGTRASGLHGFVGPQYGSPSVPYLVGGSGGGAGNKNTTNGGGGAGGGAILVASDTRISVAGNIHVRGGYAGQGPGGHAPGSFGSAGSIRLVAPLVDLAGGVLQAPYLGAPGTSSGGEGYVRVEYDGPSGISGVEQATITPETVDTFSSSLGDVFPVGAPRLSLDSWWDPALNGGAGDWVPIGQDPSAVFFPPDNADINVGQPGNVRFLVRGQGIAQGSPLFVRVSHTRGQASIDGAVNSPHTVGEISYDRLTGESFTEIEIDFAGGVTAVQLRAELP